jgi:hypothetical protein
MKKITTLILSLVFAVSIIASASAKTLKIQMTFPKTSYDAQIVGMWADRVTGLIVATASALQVSNLAQPTTYSGDYGVAEGIE